ncbi:hypothetical protein AWENTII_006455 [Aspergillus wentii]
MGLGDHLLRRWCQSSLFQTRYVQNPHSYQALAGGRDGPGLSKIGRGTFLECFADLTLTQMQFRDQALVGWQGMGLGYQKLGGGLWYALFIFIEAQSAHAHEGNNNADIRIRFSNRLWLGGRDGPGLSEIGRVEGCGTNTAVKRIRLSIWLWRVVGTGLGYRELRRIAAWLWLGGRDGPGLSDIGREGCGMAIN